MIARQYRRSILLAACALLLAAVLPAAAQPRGDSPTPGDYIVVYRDGAGATAPLTRNLERARGFKAARQFSLVKGFAARLTAAQVTALRKDPQVALVAPDLPVHAVDSFPIAAGDSAPPGVRRIEAATSTYSRGPSGVNVAVLDTGIDLAHPDLNAVNGVNCVGSGPANDDNGHGTHVAGTIGARNNGAGVIGVAPGTRLVAVKVLDAFGNGSWSSVICGIEWVTATRTDADPSNDIAVVNLSLGGDGPSVGSCSNTSDLLHRAVCASVAAGVHYVVAAGNSGEAFDKATKPGIPAAYPQVLTVTAMTDSDGVPGGLGGAPSCYASQPDDRYAGFSNFALTSAGAAHTIAAPGTCINSTWRNGGYAVISGTSMATPHVAGAVALCLDDGGTPGACAGLTPAQLITKMRADAQAHTAATPAYGYNGDPLRPASDGRYYGHLVRVGVEPPPGTAEPSSPSVTGHSPPGGATGQPTGTTISATFSEPMDQAATQAAFSLVPGGGGLALGGSFSWSGNTMTFAPAAPLGEGSTFRATIGGDALSLAGMALGAPLEWTFKTLTSGSRAPFAAVIQNRSVRSGTYARLAAADNAFFEVNSTKKKTFTTSWYARFSSVPRDSLSLNLDYDGRNTRACTQVIQLWNWKKSKWVGLGSTSVGKAGVAITVAAGGNLARFVSGSAATGEARARVRCTTGAGQFYARADYLQLRFTRP